MTFMDVFAYLQVIEYNTFKTDLNAVYMLYCVWNVWYVKYMKIWVWILICHTL